MDWENMHSQSMLFDLIPAFSRQKPPACHQISPTDFVVLGTEPGGLIMADGLI
jgi:hypothetical protein